jgi:hypothetical protein
MASGHCTGYGRYTEQKNIRYLKTSTRHELGSEGSWGKKKPKKKKPRPSQQKKKERYGQSEKKTLKRKKKNPRAPPTHPSLPLSLNPCFCFGDAEEERTQIDRSFVRCR